MSGTSSGNNRLVTIFGGRGFVGRYVVRELAARGWRIRVACRRPDLAFHLQPLGRVGQIHAIQANLRHPPSVLSAARGSDAIINLTGVLAEKGRQRFDAVHDFGARAVARAAVETGAPVMVHMSAIGADADSPSAYARSKAAGERAVREAFPDASIVRPSIIFGPEDSFFNRFAAIARISPVMPLFGGGHTKFQPVYVADVATAFADLVEGKSAAGTPGVGKTWELGGPQVKSFEELLRYICEVTGRKRLFVPVPWGMCNVQAFVLEWTHRLSMGLWPEWLTVTRDQVKLLQSDNVVSAAAQAEGRTLAGLGIAPEPYEAIVPGYLYRFRKSGQFTNTREA